MQHLLEHSTARRAFGFSDEVDLHISLDRLVGAHSNEVDVHVRAFDRMTLDLPREGELVAAVDLERDQRVRAARKDVRQLALRHRDRHVLFAQAVDDTGNETLAADAARGALLSGGVATFGGQGCVSHSGAFSRIRGDPGESVRDPELLGIVAGGVPITIAISRRSERSIVWGFPVNGLPVDVDRDRRGGLAVGPDAAGAQRHVPLGEQLPEGVVLLGGRLGVEHARGVVGVQRRDARRRARLRDPAVRRKSVDGSAVHLRIVDANTDAARHELRRAVHEDVEVRVHVILQALRGLGNESRIARQLHRIGRQRREVCLRRFGGRRLRRTARRFRRARARGNQQHRADDKERATHYMLSPSKSSLTEPSSNTASIALASSGRNREHPQRVESLLVGNRQGVRDDDLAHRPVLQPIDRRAREQPVRCRDVDLGRAPIDQAGSPRSPPFPQCRSCRRR